MEYSKSVSFVKGLNFGLFRLSYEISKIKDKFIAVKGNFKIKYCPEMGGSFSTKGSNYGSNITPANNR